MCGLESRGVRRAYQRQIGLLTAGNSGLYARMTVRQHLDYWARLALVIPPDRGARVEESIERFSLRELAGRRPDRMSMGQRQRVRIAMAFLHRPALILLDEPTNSLDDEGSAVLLGAVEEHLSTGGSALWCSPGGDGTGTHVEQRLRLVSGRLERHSVRVNCERPSLSLDGIFSQRARAGQRIFLPGVGSATAIRWISDVQPLTPALALIRRVLMGAAISGSAWLAAAKLAGFARSRRSTAGARAIKVCQARGTLIEY